VSNLQATSFVTGRFAPPLQHQFLWWRRGDSNLFNGRVNAATNGFEAVIPLQVTLPIDQLFPLLGGSQPRLLVIGSGGAEARVYAFDGMATLTLVQSLSATNGEAWTGALPGADGNFQLLSGLNGESTS